MNRHFFSLLTFFKKTSANKKYFSQIQVEDLEGRELMSATPVPVAAPKSLLIYYGYPSLINGAQSLSQVATTLGQYSNVVLGDGIEASSHPDHANTTTILANSAMAHTTVFGYVDLGVSTQNLSINQMKTDIINWKQTGVKGIFLDDFGYDFHTTRARQNTIVQYAHSQGLFVIANAYNPSDAFGSQIDSIHNPTGMLTNLKASDYYLYEDYQVLEGNYVPASDWLPKASTLARFQSQIGFKIMAETTNKVSNTFNSIAFKFAWDSALQAGYAAIGWGDFDYAADTSQITAYTTPSLAAGSTFTSGVVANGTLVTRNTNLGQIVVNTATHTGSFVSLARSHTLPITGTFKSTALHIIPLTQQKVEVVAYFDFNGTLGETTASSSVIENPVTKKVDGKVFFHIGMSKLTLTLRGSFSVSKTGVVTEKGTIAITSGTGKFAHAQGTGVFYSTTILATHSSTISISKN